MATQAQIEAKGIRQLVAAYNSTVSMIGNTMFIPTNYVYISPLALGVSEKVAYEMGLGGYYSVVKVNGKVDSTGWNTDMECMSLARSATERSRERAGAALPIEAASSTSSSPEVKKKK